MIPVDPREIMVSDYTPAQGWRPLVVDHYPDGMPLVRSRGAMGGLRHILLRPRSLHSFLTALFVVDTINAAGEAPPTLYLPYIPGARQDRRNHAANSDSLFTLKSVADEINRRKFERVIVLDPHSDVAAALIDNLRDQTPETFFPLRAGHMHPSLPHDTPRKWDIVIAPDAGAAKRAAAVAGSMGVPVLQAFKHRDVVTGKLNGFGIDPRAEDFRGKRALIVDDICDGGGTFLGLAKVIQQYDIIPSLYTTHGLYSQGLDALCNTFERVITTDSIVRDEKFGAGQPNYHVIHLFPLEK